MPLTLAEFQLRKRLKDRSRILLFDAACLLGWTKVSVIAELSGVTYDYARVQLGKLVRGGWLTVEWHGPKNGHGKVRYRPKVAAVGGSSPIAGDRTDRSSTIGLTDRPRSDSGGSTVVDARASDPDLICQGRSKDQIRPSVLGGAGGAAEGTDGRTGELREALLGWVEARHNAPPHLSRPGLMRLVNHGATEHELRAYLTALERPEHHPCFDGIQHAQFRFGAACTVERFEAWRKSRARAVRRGPSVREQLDAPLNPSGFDQAEAMAELVRRQLSGHRKRGK